MSLKRKYLTLNKKTTEVFNFIAAGLTGTTVSYIIFNICISFSSLEVFWSSVIGQIFGIGCSYLYNSRKTFKKRLNAKKKITYTSYYMIALYIVAASIKELVSNGMEPNAAWIIGVGIATICNYAIVKMAIF